MDSSITQAHNLAWTYDAVGNRLTENHGSDSDDYGYQHGSNILLDIQNTSSTNTYAQDNRGNTTHITQVLSTTSFGYNAANRPLSLTKNSATTVYRYNALGQRTTKTQGSSTTQYTYNPQGQLVGEYHNGQPIVEYIYLNNQPLAQFRNGSLYYYANDHLGTPQTLTDQNQNVVWYANYSAFGEAEITTEIVENN